MTVASLRCLDRKQDEHGERGKDDERIHYEFQPVWHDVPFRTLGRNVLSWLVKYRAVMLEP